MKQGMDASGSKLGQVLWGVVVFLLMLPVTSIHFSWGCYGHVFCFIMTMLLNPLTHQSLCICQKVTIEQKAPAHPFNNLLQDYCSNDSLIFEMLHIVL